MKINRRTVALLSQQLVTRAQIGAYPLQSRSLFSCLYWPFSLPSSYTQWKSSAYGYNVQVCPTESDRCERRVVNFRLHKNRNRNNEQNTEKKIELRMVAVERGAKWIDTNRARTFNWIKFTSFIPLRIMHDADSQKPRETRSPYSLVFIYFSREKFFPMLLLHIARFFFRQVWTFAHSESAISPTSCKRHRGA